MPDRKKGHGTDFIICVWVCVYELAPKINDDFYFLEF